MATRPPAFIAEERYLGYRAADRARPYARFYRDDVTVLPRRAEQALLAGRQPGELATPRGEIAAALAQPGYLKIENGWAVLPNGELMIAVHTPMPGVRAAMVDWWFGWHIKETARYKLWHPNAHRFTAPAEDRSDDPTLSDRERYVGNTSFIDEYIGGTLSRLAVHFQDPRTLGFVTDDPTSTAIVARGGSSDVPIVSAWLVHHVRDTPDGAEMRSRFYLGDVAVQQGVPPTVAEALDATGVLATVRAEVARLDTALLTHCAVEMSHLACILPALHAAFALPRRTLVAASG